MFGSTTLPLASLHVRYPLPTLCKLRHWSKAGELIVNRSQKLHEETCYPALCNPLLFVGFSITPLQHAAQAGVWLPTTVHKPKLVSTGTAYGLWPAMHIRGTGCAASAEFDYKLQGSSKFPRKFLPASFLITKWQELSHKIMEHFKSCLKTNIHVKWALPCWTVKLGGSFIT